MLKIKKVAKNRALHIINIGDTIPLLILDERKKFMKDLLDIEMFSCDINKPCECLNELPLAYAYVPYQKFETPYDMEEALKCGTAFPKLNKPLGVYGKEFNKKGGALKL